MDYKELNDNELISLARENNEEAINLLHNKYKPLINKKCNKYYKYVSNKGIELSDLIQEYPSIKFIYLHSLTYILYSGYCRYGGKIISGRTDTTIQENEAIAIDDNIRENLIKESD